jgi:hypothetical protein
VDSHLTISFLVQRQIGNRPPMDLCTNILVLKYFQRVNSLLLCFKGNDRITSIAFSEWCD